VTAAAFVALTDAATVATDVNDGFNAKVTLGRQPHHRRADQPEGRRHLHLDVSQDATGSRVPSWNAIWDWGASGAPTLSTGANKKDKVIAQYSAASAKLEASFRRSA
jgi:hypothetical protein